ncbi:MAG: glycosyl transferase family 2, partial [Alcaligenaceae bacterium]
YGGRALVAQDLSAVTAACLLTKVDLYKALGGLNEKHLPVAFNDVDFCLRVREAGFNVIWTPHALLYHHESVSRGKDETPARKRRALGELRYMRKRWGKVMLNDPFYSPNLNYQRPDFTLAALPRVVRPWIQR